MLKKLGGWLKAAMLAGSLLLANPANSTVYNVGTVDELMYRSLNSRKGDSVVVSPGVYTLTNNMYVYWEVDVRGVNRDNCIIDGNNRYNIKCYGTFSDLTIRNGRSDRGGGIESQIATISNCVVKNCFANLSGGGIFSSKSTVRECIVQDNTAVKYGGGIHSGDNGQVINCLITNNKTTSTNEFEGRGGGVYSYEKNWLYHNTIADNSSKEGGGIYIRRPADYSQKTILINDLIFFNTAQNYVNEDFSSEYSYCATFPSNGVNCIYVNPLFVDKVNKNYHLSLSSPCIDAGQNGITKIDIEKKPRPIDADYDGRNLADIGCYEEFKKISDEDYDGDGIPNSWEIAKGLNPYVRDQNEDPDKDGFSNLQEYVMDSNPFDPNSYFRGISIKSSGNETLEVSILGPTSQDRYYRVYSSTNIVQPSWMEEYGSHGNNQNLVYSASTTGSNFKIYRGNVNLE